MTPAHLLSLEGRAFLLALAATLAWMLLTRRIATAGLLLLDSGGVSPERVQLLIATLVVSGHLLLGVLASSTTSMPEMDARWVYGFGGSGLVYAGVKAARTRIGKVERRVLR